MTQRFSYSSLQTLMHCERQYSLGYLENLEADKAEPIPFLRGTAFHAVVAADLMQRGAELGSLLNFPDKIKLANDYSLGIDWNSVPGIVDRKVPTVVGWELGPEVLLTPYSVIEHVRVWESQLETERQEEIIAKLNAPLHERLLDMWTRYRAHWADRMASELPLLVEFQWERPAPNGILLQGRLDAVVYDTENCLTIVRDTKTHDSWPSEPDAVMDLLNSQLHLQGWGVAPALRELGGRDIGGVQEAFVPQAVEFDRARIKKPTTPKLTTRGVLSKSITDFDGYTYKNWCESAEAKEAGYEFEQAVWDKAEEDQESWFRRSLKPLSLNAIRAHVMSMQTQAERASKLDPKKAAIQPSNSCAWCPFLNLCRAEIIGGRPDPLYPSEYGLRLKKV